MALIEGTFGSDTMLYGTDEEDDTIFGFEGNDKAYGFGGDDVLDGGKGADYLSGGLGRDWASYASATDGIIASLSDPTINQREADGDTYNSIENLIGSNFNDSLIGTNGNNAMRGGSGRDGLQGLDGNDTLAGNDGDDFLTGGLGADYLSGGTGTDIAFYQSAATGVVVSLLDPSINTGEAAGDTYNSVENIDGGHFDDVLHGSNGIGNILHGGFGNDTLYGHTGNDELAGNSGRDIFVFNTALNEATNVDTITDYARFDDTMWLDDSIFLNIATNPDGTIVSSAFKEVLNGPIDSNDRIIYVRAGGNLFYDRDGSGSAYAPVQFAVLDDNTALTAADFVVI